MDVTSQHDDAIEVIAQFDGAILDVQHVLPRTAATLADERRARALVAGGGAALAVALGFFASSCAHVSLPRAVDWLVALLLTAGTWLLLRGLSRVAERRRHEYTVGDDARADFALPIPTLPLVRATADGWELSLAPALGGQLVRDGATLTLAEARAGGAASIALAAQARALVTVGSATFNLARVPAPEASAGRAPIDWRREIYTGGVALVVSAFMFMLYSLPPQPQSLALDQMRQHSLAHFILTPPEPPPPPPTKGPASDGGRGSAPAAGRSGDIGRVTAPRQHAQLRFKGTSKDEVKRIAGGAAAEAGILPLIGGSQIGAVFGPDHPLGADKETVLGDLRGEMLSDGYGHGLDLVGRGDGPGGGGREQTIGVGKLHGIGECPTCTDGRNRYGSQLPSARMVHVAKAPDIVPGQAEVRCGVNGACLDKEIVKRVIHRHKPEVRFCYEQQLLHHAELNGRVLTQFTIAPSGRVLGSAVMESSVHDRAVEQCIVQALRRWEFPQSGQTSIVTYPFILQSAGR